MSYLRFCFVCLRHVYPMLSVSLTFICFVFLRHVYPMLSVFLYCSFLIVPLVFPSIYLLATTLNEND